MSGVGDDGGAPIRALVVDDEPLARDELCFLLSQCDGVQVIGEAKDAAEAMSRADELSPDVAFVDLRMPGPDGIALAEALLGRAPEMRVVVVSAHDDGALRAFEARVSDYLLKPVRLERLRRAVSRIVDELSAPRPDTATAVPAPEGAATTPLTRLAVKRRGSYVVVDVADVIWFEVKDELVWAITADDRFALDLTLSAIEKRVPESLFFRSHRGYLVRLDRIRSIEPTGGAGTFDLMLDHPDSPRVPLARERARTLRELIPVAG